MHKEKCAMASSHNITKLIEPCNLTTLQYIHGLDFLDTVKGNYTATIFKHIVFREDPHMGHILCSKKLY